MKTNIVSMISILSILFAFVQTGGFGQDVVVSGILVEDIPLKVGESLTLSASSDGTPPFEYAWHKDGKPISGATNVQFSISKVAPTDTAIYSVVVSNSAGSAGSSNVMNCRVIVLPPKEAVDTYEVIGMWQALRKDFALASSPKCLKLDKTKGGQI